MIENPVHLDFFGTSSLKITRMRHASTFGPVHTARWKCTTGQLMDSVGDKRAYVSVKPRVTWYFLACALTFISGWVELSPHICFIISRSCKVEYFIIVRCLDKIANAIRNFINQWFQRDLKQENVLKCIRCTTVHTSCDSYNGGMVAMTLTRILGSYHG
jgi:hypothetical protein